MTDNENILRLAVLTLETSARSLRRILVMIQEQNLADPAVRRTIRADTDVIVPAVDTLLSDLATLRSQFEFI